MFPTFVATLMRLIMGAFYNTWIFIIYIVSMTLTTFWAQDIFDEMVQIKLSRLPSSLNDSNVSVTSKRVKNPGKVL